MANDLEPFPCVYFGVQGSRSRSRDSRRPPSGANSWKLRFSLRRSSPWRAAFGRNSESASVTKTSSA